MKKNDIPLNERFEELALPRKDLPNLVGTHYRVYSRDGQFVRVEAINALEAIKKSNMQDIKRIERDTIYLNRIVDMSKMVDSVAKPVSPAPEKKTEAPAAQPVEAKAEDALSTQDVQSLVAADSVDATPEAGAEASVS